MLPETTQSVLLMVTATLLTRSSYYSKRRLCSAQKSEATANRMKN